MPGVFVNVGGGGGSTPISNIIGGGGGQGSEKQPFPKLPVTPGLPGKGASTKKGGLKPSTVLTRADVQTFVGDRKVMRKQVRFDPDPNNPLGLGHPTVEFVTLSTIPARWVPAEPDPAEMPDQRRTTYTMNGLWSLVQRTGRLEKFNLGQVQPMTTWYQENLEGITLILQNYNRDQGAVYDVIGQTRKLIGDMSSRTSALEVFLNGVKSGQIDLGGFTARLNGVAGSLNTLTGVVGQPQGIAAAVRGRGYGSLLEWVEDLDKHLVDPFDTIASTVNGLMDGRWNAGLDPGESRFEATEGWWKQVKAQISAEATRVGLPDWLSSPENLFDTARIADRVEGMPFFQDWKTKYNAFVTDVGDFKTTLTGFKDDLTLWTKQARAIFRFWMMVLKKVLRASGYWLKQAPARLGGMGGVLRNMGTTVSEKGKLMTLRVLPGASIGNALRDLTGKETLDEYSARLDKELGNETDNIQLGAEAAFRAVITGLLGSDAGGVVDATAAVVEGATRLKVQSGQKVNAEGVPSATGAYTVTLADIIIHLGIRGIFEVFYHAIRSILSAILGPLKLDMDFTLPVVA